MDGGVDATRQLLVRVRACCIFFPILAAHWLAHIVHYILSETRAVIDLGGSKEAPKLVV